jgi:hypothetical protein
VGSIGAACSLRQGLVFLLAVWLAGLLHGPAQSAPAFQPLQLQRAQFQRLDAGADAAWQWVTLPDTWAARGLPQSGSAHYRLSFVLPAVPDEAIWALQFDRLSTTHTLRVNGVLVNHQRGSDGGNEDIVRLATSGKPIPLLAEFPALLNFKWVTLREG